MATTEYMRAYRATKAGQEVTRHANMAWRDRNKEKASAATQRWKRENPAKYVLSQAIQRAKRTGLGHTISLNEVEILLEPMTCALTGWSLKWDWDHKLDPLAPSLDRIDNARGYVPGNVRVTCWLVNKMRGNLSDEELLDVAAALLKNARR